MIGQTLSHFRITAKLGEGGMGEVYRAEDTRLGREVAIKVLPGAFTEDAERLARFEREAHLLASLNHPNIAAIFGLEAVDERQFLVLELVEGETLQDHLSRGPLPVPEALGIARQIAEGLEAAHRAGVVHRDLKPANIKITPEGQVKVLDFGLAASLRPDTADSDLSQSPTLTAQMTQAGVILGTAAYMSPEQARGKVVDKQADVWAFGVVLYEMLTGERPFGGETITDILAAVIEREPDWAALPPQMPILASSLLRRCLRKDQTERLHDIGDARIEIEEALAEPMPVQAEGLLAIPSLAARGWRGHLGLLVGAVLIAAVTGLIVWGVVRPGPDSPVKAVRLALTIPESAPLRDYINNPSSVTISPDGTRVVYVAEGDGRGQLYVRPLDRLDAQPIKGTEGARNPFFSPDGRSVGFWQEGQMKRTFLEAGRPSVVCDAPRLRGASWGADGTILFTPEPKAGLWRVSADGGAPTQVTTPDREAGEGSHRWPHLLPSGDAALFTIPAPSGRQDDARIAWLDLETGRWDVLIEGGSEARYTSSGHVVYARNGSLLAVRFDAERLKVIGQPQPVLDDVRMLGRGLVSAHFDVAADGTLAYVPGYPAPSKRTLVWVDRQGEEVEVASLERRAFGLPRLSPDGQRVAVAIEGPETDDIWVLELRNGTWNRLTFEKDNALATWSPDGEQIVFTSNREGHFNLYRVTASGSTPPERLTNEANWHWPSAWSPDGRHLAYSRIGDEGDSELWMLELDDQVRSRPFRALRGTRAMTEFSPDGRWVAYESSESGRPEVYIEPFPGPGDKWPVSRNGGRSPRWSRDGRELFYRSGDRMMAAAVVTGPSLQVGEPRELFRRRFGAQSFRDYDVSLDDRRFLMIDPGDDVPQRLQIIIVPNWFEELDRIFADTSD